MKTYLLVALFSLVTPCSFAEVVQLNPEYKYTAGGVLTSESRETSGGIGYLIYHESGNDNGVDYIIHFADASGVFRGELVKNRLPLTDDPSFNWLLSCYQDNMTDKRSCSARKQDLTVTYYDNGANKVSLGTNNFSGSRIYARIEDGDIISGLGYGYFASNDSKNIINALLAGKTIRTRWQDWPYQSKTEGKVSGYGFRQVSDYMKWVLAGQHIGSQE